MAECRIKDGSRPTGIAEQAEVPNRSITDNGYVLVYLTNASNTLLYGPQCYSCGDVFFDDLTIRFSRGQLKEESHYYPFGLPMAKMGSAAAGFKENRRKYQANEYNRDFGLNWMNFHNRQLGLP